MYVFLQHMCFQQLKSRTKLPHVSIETDVPFYLHYRSRINQSDIYKFYAYICLSIFFLCSSELSYHLGLYKTISK